jgi:hypothetical protein
MACLLLNRLNADAPGPAGCGFLPREVSRCVSLTGGSSLAEGLSQNRTMRAYHMYAAPADLAVLMTAYADVT